MKTKMNGFPKPYNLPKFNLKHIKNLKRLGVHSEKSSVSVG